MIWPPLMLGVGVWRPPGNEFHCELEEMPESMSVETVTDIAVMGEEFVKESFSCPPYTIGLIAS